MGDECDRHGGNQALRKLIQNMQKKPVSRGRLRPEMTLSKLLRNNIHHKTRVIIFIVVVCLNRFSNEATALFA